LPCRLEFLSSRLPSHCSLTRLRDSEQLARPYPPESPLPPWHRPLSFQPEPDLSCVLTIPTRYRDLGQQRVAAGHTRRSVGAEQHCRHTEGRAVSGTEMRCAILGI